MVNIQMTNPAVVADFERRAKKFRLGKSDGFIKALWNVFACELDTTRTYVEWSDTKYAFEMAYKELCGYSAGNCESFDEFFCSKLTSALNDYFGKKETARIREECALAMECPYAHDAYRPSYRSKRAGDYADEFFSIIINAISFACFDLPLKQLLVTTKTDNYILGTHIEQSNRLALALRRKDAEIIALVEEAILGDNSQITMSHTIISGIVKSGKPQMLEQLGKLLLAAKGQEGLRQAILETCDSGTIESHIYFIKLILENRLCRFSSVVRAFDTWSGLGFGDQKQKVAEKCMGLALKYLSDENAVEAGLDSNDTTEIYLALWSMCCRDAYGTIRRARQLLNSADRYKRLVGWYFISHTANEALCHTLAVEYLGVRDPEELAWVCDNLHINQNVYNDGRYGWSYINGNFVNGSFTNNEDKKVNQNRYFDEHYPSSEKERASLFTQLTEAAKFIGYKKTRFTESFFPWYTQELNASAVHGVMLGLAAYDMNKDLIRRLFEFLPLMSNDYKLTFYALLLNPENAEQRMFLLTGLSDKSQNIRKMIVNRLNLGKQTLTATDLERLSKALTTKNTDLRKGIMTLFEKQGEELMRPVIEMLLQSHDTNQFNAGVELREIFSKTTKELNEENGFGLFNPNAEDFHSDIRAKLRPNVPKIDDSKLKALMVPDEKVVLALYENIADVFVKNTGYEYETEYWDGSRHKVLLNNEQGGMSLLAGKRRSKHNPITDYPLADEWLKAVGGLANDKEKMAVIFSLMHGHYSFSNKILPKWFRVTFDGYPIEMDKNAIIEKIDKIVKSKVAHVYKTNQVLRAIMNTGEESLFDFAFSAYVNLIRKIPVNKLDAEFEDKETGKGYYYPLPSRGILSAEYLEYWRQLAYRHIKTDEQFTEYFNEMWWQILLAGQKKYYGLNDEDIFRAHNLGLISDNAVFVYFTIGADAPEHIRNMTNTAALPTEIFNKYPAAKGMIAKTIDTIVTVEETRGELPSALTVTAASIQRFDGGARRFVNLLSALGDMGFLRLHSFAHGDLNKQESLSKLLRCCRPVAEDTPEMLREALKNAGISEKRVIQAALFAPLWAGLLEKAMDIKGLKCSVWFFHAHINENFSVEKETEVAIYSAIAPQQFNDGAFDKDWFLEAYQTLGEKRFNELYKNAKYMTHSSNAHRRSQLYADAVLGRLLKEETKVEIIEKRNQEKLRAYALIPLDLNNSNDALERYEFIQNYKKESRQFGSARQASEGKACQIALDNLAITTGYGNADRMIWALEGAKIELLRPLMEPCSIGDTEIWLNIAEDGTPDLAVRKNGKLLKGLPKELAKNEIALEIREAVKQIRDQKRRARYSFEAAMISRSEFPAKEIIGLLKHPILSGMVSSLVFASNGCMGFPILNGNNLELIDADGNSHTVTGGAIIAHPHNFIQQGCWSNYQQYLYRNQIIQPFKQVFREYYPVTQDELDAVNITRRYAGHQVQPKKTVSLLKTRGWTADYEEGLQRVWHKENLVVRLYALADWFSPADIEAPTLEAIKFFSRDKFEPIPFKDIPPVIFSETMRDIDLVVSVAHAGGVDPEASHSTIEMRIAIAGELLSMLSVGNVSFKTAHALITGSMGEYSVHMGSGVTHKAGAGMLAVLPVHSQSRGRIFLPFADDDPKTAEILAKILLFANDKKIKDPAILRQIKQGQI